MSKKTNQNDSFNFDYSRISDEVSQNIREQMPQQASPQKRKYPRWKRILLATTYTLLVCAIVATSTWGIQRAFAEENTKIVFVGNESTSGGSSLVAAIETKYMEKFDRFICCGRLTTKELLLSFLLNEEDKAKILHAVTHENGGMFVDVYLGEIDGKDYIYISMLAGYWGLCEQCDSIFSKLYKSGLEYTLKDVVTAFEGMIGESLTDEYLTAKPDVVDGLGVTTGINMVFVHEDYYWFQGASKYVDEYQRETVMHEYRFNGDWSDAEVVEQEDGTFIVSKDFPWGFVSTHADEIYSMDENGLHYGYYREDESCYSEIYYTIYNNQMYVVNRSYIFTGQMFWRQNPLWPYI